jgi:hypothetical protein
MLIVYVPVPPKPVPRAVINVLFVIPVPLISIPSLILPELISVTVSVVPEIDAVNEADSEGVPVIVVEPTDCVMLIGYVPIPPSPPEMPVILVPGVTPVPVIVIPETMLPELTAVTLSVVPTIVAVNEADTAVLIVYVPTPPVPVPSAVIVLPDGIPISLFPVIVIPTDITPIRIEFTVSVVPEITATKEAAIGTPPATHRDPFQATAKQMKKLVCVTEVKVVLSYV